MTDKNKDIKQGQLVEKTFGSGFAARLNADKQPAEPTPAKPVTTDGANKPK